MFVRDWALLQEAMTTYARLVREGAELRALFVAEAEQNIHRLNILGEGVRGLPGAILAGVGLYGLALPRRDAAPRKPGEI